MRDEPPPTARCDFGETTQITVGVADYLTGAAVNPSSMVCTVTRPNGTADTVTMSNVSTGLYRGFYSNVEVGTHAGLVTTTYAGGVVVKDRFRIDVQPIWPVV